LAGIGGLGKIGKGKKWGFKLNNVVDVVGRYVPNGSGGRPLLGGQEERGGDER